MNNSPKSNSYDPNVTKELLFHVDNLFHTRVNFFLTAEAIFFAALATVWTQQGVSDATCIFGTLFTLVLATTNLNLSRRLKWLMDTYATVEASGVYRDYRTIQHRGTPETRLVFSLVIPGIALLAWLVALISRSIN